MMTVDTLSARDRKVKKEIRIRIPTTAGRKSENGFGGQRRLIRAILDGSSYWRNWPAMIGLGMV
jgi:hypothetical protein